jgi:hypothetical protein
VVPLSKRTAVPGSPFGFPVDGTDCEYLKNSIDYLRARVSHRRLPTNKDQFFDSLAYAQREYDREHYGHARFALENLLAGMPEPHPSYLEAAVLLAGSCAQMNDIKAVIQIIKPVLNDLVQQGNRQTMTNISDWLFQYVAGSDYSELEDELFRWGLNIELLLTRSASTLDEVLRPLRDLTRWLELLGAVRTAKMLRDLIRREAPGTLYVDKHDRLNYFRNVELSENMGTFLEEFDARIKLTAVGKVTELMGSEHSIDDPGSD